MTSFTKHSKVTARGPQLLKGLAELAVLSSMCDGPQYGLSILDRLKGEAGLDVAEGSIYPMLHRLERAGSIQAEWRLDDQGARPRKYYELTEAGRCDLNTAMAEWTRISQTLNTFLNRTTGNEQN